MPLLPVNLSGTKLWVEVDGRVIDKMERCAAGIVAAPQLAEI
jgi:hypothetical protein